MTIETVFPDSLQRNLSLWFIYKKLKLGRSGRHIRFHSSGTKHDHGSDNIYGDKAIVSPIQPDNIK